MAITLGAHFGIERRMESCATDGRGRNGSARKMRGESHFNRLHVWSERLEGSVFFGGLVLMYP